LNILNITSFLYCRKADALFPEIGGHRVSG
jgi:hypothetical protein